MSVYAYERGTVVHRAHARHQDRPACSVGVGENPGPFLPVEDGALPYCSKCWPGTEKRTCVVYFIHTGKGSRGRRGGLIKIGSTTDLERRIPQLAFWFGDDLTVLATMPGDATDERAIHKAFAAERHGRWELFDPSPRLLAYIEGIPAVAEVAA